MSHRSRRRALQSPLCRAVLLFVTACVFLVCADGQKTPPPHPLGPAIPESSRPPQTKPADSHELSPADISSFLDGLVS